MARRRHVAIWAHDEGGFQMSAPRDWIERVEADPRNQTRCILIMRPGFNGPARLIADEPAYSVVAQLRDASGEDESE